MNLFSMKLPGVRPGPPGNVTSFYIVPLNPAHSAGLAGHVPVKTRPNEGRNASPGGIYLLNNNQRED
jgi:hypothetical protein